ncbi:U32 family peptidase [Nocardia jiangxiensis]|uniref:U32 family peptidase n=1 Tax=Nocardia jiangxiensis TaxID=282685 RepID=A0ABW6S0B8_9NOCA|nr:U32 family peptidase [Nocardia jiangxiensis]
MSVREFLRASGMSETDGPAPATSEKRFPDGAQYRVEIPSVEGPAVLAAVLDEARARDVRVHRISQGSGVLLLTDDELSDMAARGAAEPVEVSLFARPLAGWGTGAAAAASGAGAVGAQARGAEQLAQCLLDIERAANFGLRSVLITDIGVLASAARMREQDYLPADMQFKISVQMGLANPAAIRIAQDLGANTYNVPTDLSLAQLAEIRRAVDIPLDIYVEAPDDQGGFVRHYEIAELVRVAAPVYLKFGLRNAPNIYPSGTHLEGTAVALGRERVRRARIGLDLLRRFAPDAITSELGAAGLAVPSPVGAVAK